MKISSLANYDKSKPIAVLALLASFFATLLITNLLSQSTDSWLITIIPIGIYLMALYLIIIEIFTFDGSGIMLTDEQPWIWKPINSICRRIIKHYTEWYKHQQDSLKDLLIIFWCFLMISMLVEFLVVYATLALVMATVISLLLLPAWLLMFIIRLKNKQKSILKLISDCWPNFA